MQEQSTQQENTNPPLFKSWSGIYIFILALHVLVIAAFFLFTLIFNTP